MTKKSLIGNTPEFTTLPLAAVRPNPFNPRKNFSGPEFDDLVKSIQSAGILQPLLVRPKKKGTSTHEVVFGGRRLAACQQLAKDNGGTDQATVLVRIKKIDDDTALDLMIVENLQREDLAPLEEADQFKLFVDKHGADAIPDLAERTGLEAWYIRRRLLLPDLPKKVLAWWQKGDLSFEHVEQLLRLRCKKSVIIDLAQNTIEWEESAGQLQMRIAENSAGLEKAKFDIKAAGCETCSANSDVQKDLYNFDASATICLNMACYKKKLTAHLNAGWKKSTWWRKHKSTGFIFWNDPATEDVNIHWIHGEDTATEKCKECKDHVTLFELDGRLKHARACLGSYECLQEQNKKGRTQAAAAERKRQEAKAQKEADKLKKQAGEDPGAGSQDAASQPDPDPPAARSDWHGTWARGEFYKQQLPLTYEKLLSGQKLDQLTLFNLVNGYDDIHKWYAVRAGLATEKQVVNWFRLDAGDLFDYIITLDQKALDADLRAVALQIAMKSGQYYLQVKDRFARHIGVNVSGEFAITEEYLQKKTIAEMLHLGKVLEVFEDKAAQDYLEKTLDKKPGCFKQCKKTDLIDVFIKSGVDLVGKVPPEIFDEMPKVKAVKK